MNLPILKCQGGAKSPWPLYLGGSPVGPGRQCNVMDLPSCHDQLNLSNLYFTLEQQWSRSAGVATASTTQQSISSCECGWSAADQARRPGPAAALLPRLLAACLPSNLYLLAPTWTHKTRSSYNQSTKHFHSQLKFLQIAAIKGAPSRFIYPSSKGRMGVNIMDLFAFIRLQM